jgi:hypothetical protein
MVQENLAAQQQEQFPPVLGAPTRFASKKERSGAATGMLSVPGTRQGGLEAGSTWSAKLSLSFTSRTFCKVLSSVSFNLQLVQDPSRARGDNVPISHIMDGCSVLEVRANQFEFLQPIGFSKSSTHFLTPDTVPSLF